MAVDLTRITAAALEALLQDEGEPAKAADNGGRRLGGVGAVALGVGLAVGARAVYNRARQFDLERVGQAIENKLGG
jgi:hypothetical protein